VVIRGKNRRTKRKPCSDATFPSMNVSLSRPGPNQSLRGEKRASSNLGQSSHTVSINESESISPELQLILKNSVSCRKRRTKEREHSQCCTQILCIYLKFTKMINYKQIQDITQQLCNSDTFVFSL
jgi:hypothetical protein